MWNWLKRRRERERDLEREIGTHLDLEAEEHLEAGVSTEAARLAARKAFGNTLGIQELCRETWGWNALEQFRRDAFYGFRMLVRKPVFTAVAVCSLALGIGANTAIFNVVNAVLLRPLPYFQPDRLVALNERSPQSASYLSVSYPNFLDWQKQNQTCEDLAAFRGDGFNLTGHGAAERLQGRHVSSSFFSILRVTPILGRTFTAAEDRPGGAPVVVIDEGFWRRRFGGDPAIVGQALTLNGVAHTVVGVVPSDFQFLPFRQFEQRDSLYAPLAEWNNAILLDRNFHAGLTGIGRLKPGQTLNSARADFTRIGRLLAAQYPASNKDRDVAVAPLMDLVVGNSRGILYILLGAVTFLLLIACANVANLLLAQATARRQEIGVRTALGAGRLRIVRQLLTESALLSLAGGGAGLALATWGTHWLTRIAPRFVPRLDSIAVDGRVLAFTLLASVLSGILFGLAPAMRFSSSEARTPGPGVVRGRNWLRDLLVVGEIALSLALLAGGALMIRTLWNLQRVNPGFDPSHMLTFQISLSPADAETGATIRRAYSNLLDRVRSVPGVESASVLENLPMGGDEESLPLWVEGRQAPRSMSDMTWAMMYPTTPDYLKTMRIPLLRGRFFTDHDNQNSPPVVAIDEVMARSLFGSADPIGHRLMIGPWNAALACEIVGVVGHVKHSGLDDDLTANIRFQLYTPFLNLPDYFLKAFSAAEPMIVRTTSDPLALTDAVRGAILAGDRDQTVFGFLSMDQLVGDTMSQRRFMLLLLAIFAGVALLLAAVGVYGVISYSAAQRTREIGIRMALGARRADVLKLVVGQGAILALAGVAVGIGVAFLVTRSMSSLLFGVGASDPLSFAAVAFVLAGIALLATLIPARRAAKVDPLAALRYE